MTEAKSREADDLPAEGELPSLRRPAVDLNLAIEELEQRIAKLEEANEVKGMVIRILQETVTELLDDLHKTPKATKPGQETKDRKKELISALLHNNNRPIALADFEFEGGTLSKDQRKRLIKHLKKDPGLVVYTNQRGKKAVYLRE